MLIVPRDHPLAGVGQVPRDGLYSLTFVSLNAGSSVQIAQETTLRKHGILWRRLKIDMVSPPHRRRTIIGQRVRCRVGARRVWPGAA